MKYYDDKPFVSCRLHNLSCSDIAECEITWNGNLDVVWICQKDPCNLIVDSGNLQSRIVVQLHRVFQ